MPEGCRSKITMEGQITDQHMAKRFKVQKTFPIPFLRLHEEQWFVRSDGPTELHLNGIYGMVGKCRRLSSLKRDILVSPVPISPHKTLYKVGRKDQQKELS